MTAIEDQVSNQLAASRAATHAHAGRSYSRLCPFPRHAPALCKQDWTGMCAPIAGCGCITVNDQLCAWTRWTPAGLDKVDDLAAPALGACVYEFEQIARP